MTDIELANEWRQRAAQYRTLADNSEMGTAAGVLKSAADDLLKTAERLERRLVARKQQRPEAA